MDNKSLPLEYKFDFVIDEISNINDKSQVNVDIIEFPVILGNLSFYSAYDMLSSKHIFPVSCISYSS